MSLKTYRRVDILIFTILAIILDFINIFAFSKFPLGGFTISLHLILALISIIRWGYLGSVVAILGGLSYSIIATGFGENGFSLSLVTLSKIIPYTLGNGFIVLTSLYFIKFEKKDITNKIYLLIIYIISGFILAILGRSLIGMFYGQDFLITFKEYGSREIFNAVIGFVIISVAKKQDGLVEDVYNYLVRFKQKEANHQQQIILEGQGSDAHE